MPSRPASPDVRRQEQLTALREVLATVPLALIPNLALLACEALGAWLMLAEGELLATHAAQGEAVAALATAVCPRGSGSLVSRTAHEARVVPTAALDSDAVLAPLAHVPGSLVLVPIAAGDALLGLLGVVMAPGAAADLDLLTALAGQIPAMLPGDTPAQGAARHPTVPGLRLQRQLLDAIPHAVVAAEADGTVVVWNCAAEQLYGRPAAEAIGRSVLDLTLSAEAQSPGARVLARIQAGTGWSGDDLAQGRDGSTLPVASTVSPIVDVDGAVLGLVGVSHDISAQRAAEQALRRSEARFHQFAAAVGDIFWISDPRQRRVLYVSPAYEQIMGRSTAALYANFMEWLAAIHPEDRPRVEAAFFSRAHADGYDEEFRIIRPDGSLRWIRDRSFPMLDEDGGRTGAAGIAEDITARKQAETALHESERRYRELVEYANSAIIRWTGDGTLVFFNEYAQRLFGYRPEEILGQPVSRLVPETESTGGDLRQLAADIVAYPERYVNFVNENVCRDGRRFWMAWTNRPIYDDQGQVSAILAVGNDITARKQAEVALRESEERFRTLTDSVPQVIWTADGEGRAVYFNQRWLTYSGLSHEASLGSGWQQIVHPDDAAEVAAQWQQALAAGEVFQREYRLRGADGRYRWHLGRAVPLREEGGRIGGWFGSATDIDELKQAEAARHERDTLRRLAAAQEEERLRIARDLHDQLGQQITGLQLGLKQLEGHVPGAAAAMLAPLQSLAHDLAKEAHRIAMNLRPTALEDVGLAPALERLVADWSAQTGIAAAFERLALRAQRLPRPVEVALFRVVQEALTNVQKHAGATNVGVILDQGDHQVVVVIEDNGCGFIGEDARDSGLRPPLGILGIRERVSQVGGTVEIETSPTDGTAVFVRIPL